MTRLAKLLVIDNNVTDSIHASSVLQAALASLKSTYVWEVSVVQDCFDGLNHLFLRAFDAVIVNANVLGFSAMNFLHTIRTYGHTMPVILLLSQCEVSHRSAEQAHLAGFDALLPSPFTAVELYSAIIIRSNDKRARSEDCGSVKFAPSSPTSTAYISDSTEECYKNSRQRCDSLSPFFLDDDLLELLSDL